MKCYALPYEGDQPFIFISFCHKDEALVWPLIERLTIDGFRVWYDDGLHPGDDWPEVVGTHISQCSACIAVISAESSRSHNCNNERTFAINENKPLVSVILEKFYMSTGVRLQISASNYINYYDYAADPDAFYAKLEASRALETCYIGKKADREAYDLWKIHKDEYQRGVEKPKQPAKPALDRFKADYLDGVIWSAAQEQEKEVTPVPDDEEPGTIVEEQKEPADELDATVDESKKGSLLHIEIEEDEFDKTIDESDFDKTIRQKPIVIPTIAIIIRKNSGEIFRVKQQEISLGRDKDQVDFFVEDTGKVIGRHHADISTRDGRFFLRDNDSTNGTFHAGVQLQGDPVELSEFDEFCLAEEPFFFATGESMSNILTSEVRGYLAMMTASDTGERRLLTDIILPLDRNHLWNNGVLKDKTVNRENHACVFLEKDEYYLQDINSTNGTFLNGDRLSHGEKRKLKDGDTILVAHTPFLFSVVSLQQINKEITK